MCFFYLGVEIIRILFYFTFPNNEPNMTKPTQDLISQREFNLGQRAINPYYQIENNYHNKYHKMIFY